MLSTICSISALLLSFAILSLGHGLQNTLIGLRASIEHYSELSVGLMMSGYFIGFLFGTRLATKLLPIIGQIRSFAVFASIASIISLLHSLLVNETTWILLRLCYGCCTSALYVILESWLNALSNRTNRGQILSIYMMTNFICLAAGQMFIFIAEPSQYILFSIVSILISISFIPLTISTSKQPEIITSEHFKISHIYKVSPLASIGCIATGLILSSFWGFGAIFFTQMGLPANNVAIIMFFVFIGAFSLQWPLGYLSDLIDRRIVIAVILLLSSIICLDIIFLVNKTTLNFGLIISAILFGGFSYTLYSLFIAHANDLIHPKFLVKASGALIRLHACGAISGPVITATFIFFTGFNGLFIFIGAVNIIVFTITIYQILREGKRSKTAIEEFVALPRTSSAIFSMDPRQN